MSTHRPRFHRTRMLNFRRPLIRKRKRLTRKHRLRRTHKRHYLAYRSFAPAVVRRAKQSKRSTRSARRYRMKRVLQKIKKVHVFRLASQLKRSQERPYRPTLLLTTRTLTKVPAASSPKHNLSQHALVLRGITHPRLNQYLAQSITSSVLRQSRKANLGYAKRNYLAVARKMRRATYLNLSRQKKPFSLRSPRGSVTQPYA
jgi:hypothetical protein